MLDTVRLAETRRWVQLYRRLGFQPLPSRMDDPQKRKKPCCAYAQWWEAPAPLDELWKRYETLNIQVMTGRFWGLCVLDLDGGPAIEEWGRLAAKHGGCPDTWVSHSGGGGQHWWFSTPRGMAETGKSVLWAVWDEEAKGWKKHQAIELLCDRSLVMAPPSVHPKTGRVYKWLDKRHSPLGRGLVRPELLPAWVLKLPRVTAPRQAPAPVVSIPMRTVTRPKGVRWRSADVLEAIHDKASLAASWGLRFATRRENAAGWMQVHAIGREDRNPSASFSESKGGRYWEPGQKSIGLFDLAVQLGVYASYWDAVSDLADRYHVRSSRSA